MHSFVRTPTDHPFGRIDGLHARASFGAAPRSSGRAERMDGAVAIRRAKQKQQVIEKLTASAPPGETFIATVHCETGPSPWLNAIFDEVPFLGLIVALTRKFYFITLTNTSIVINNANRFTNRPGEIVAVFPRQAVP